MLTTPYLFFIGPAASGKTTFINALAEVVAPDSSVKTRPFTVLDDMPWMMEVFKNDDERESMGDKRLFSVRNNVLYSVTDERIFLEFSRKLGQRLDEIFKKGEADGHELVVTEFCRYGKSAYEVAFSNISSEVLRKSSIIYLSVSYEETRTRNKHRFENKTHPGAHCLPEGDLLRMNSGDDWNHLTQGRDSGTIQLRGNAVPYVTVHNDGWRSNRELVISCLMSQLNILENLRINV